MSDQPNTGDYVRSWLRPIAAIAIRPWLWRAAARFVPNAPWRLSSWRGLGPYVRFRMETAYGSPTAVPTASDAVEFLGWCRTAASPSHSASKEADRGSD